MVGNWSGRPFRSVWRAVQCQQLYDLIQVKAKRLRPRDNRTLRTSLAEYSRYHQRFEEERVSVRATRKSESFRTSRQSLA